MLTVKGTLKRKEETNVVSDKFQKREFVIETTDEQYPQTIAFECTQARVELLDNVKVGDKLNVYFNLKGREWTSPKDGSVRVFNTLDAWKIEEATASASASANGGQGEPALSVDSEELPF